MHVSARYIHHGYTAHVTLEKKTALRVESRMNTGGDGGT